jgi:glycosyltransferase involved in cell wall biosynthesis
MKVCLNMIVKNESAVILRMLKSVEPIIDAFLICDTGSTDNTVELIETFARERNLPGKVIHAPFIDFEKTRTVALHAAQQLIPDADYLLLMDADMVLKILPNFSKSDLKHCVHNVRQGTASFNYENPRFVQRALPCRYLGVTHEYLSIETPSHTSSVLETVFIDDIGDGGAKADKYPRDVRLLLKGIEDNPRNERYHFYLANTYHDMGENENAILYYKKRVDFGGWNEEVYYSLFRMSVCYKRLGNIDQFLLYGMKAWQFRPSRCESIYELMKHYRETKEFKLTLALYQLVKDLPVPKDSLFVHSYLYQHQIHHEFTLAAFYAGVTENVYPAFRYLFEHLDVYAQLNNYKFYVPTPRGVSTSLACEHAIDGMLFRGSSPSLIALQDGTYLVNVRLVNYKIRPDGSYDSPNGIICTKNKRLRLGPQLQVLESTVLSGSPTEERRTLPGSTEILSGIEDLKLMNYGGMIYYSGTVLNRTNKIGMAYGVYGDTLLPTEMTNLTECEKNWVFVPGKQGRMIYKWQPLTLGNIKGNELVLEEKTYEMPNLFGQARGSTNGVTFKDNYWFVVHFVHKYENEPRFYYNSLVVFDTDMKLLKYSLPFKFSKTPIEYCLGIVVEETRILLGHSINDSDARIGQYPHDAFHFVTV